MARVNNAEVGRILGSKKYPKLDAIKKDSRTGPIVDKLIRSHQAGLYGGITRRSATPPAGDLIKRISDKTTQSINDSTNIFQLLPDTELAMQILISSILSPKDMVTVELNYGTNSKLVAGEVGGALLDSLTKQLEQGYNIKKDLSNILEETLFTKGSYPLLVLPESSIDELINGDNRLSMEDFKGELNNDNSFKRSVGILGNGKENRSTGMESFLAEPKTLEDTETVLDYGNSKLSSLLPGTINVCDNLQVLKFPKALKKVRKHNLRKVMSTNKTGLETKRKGEKKLTDQQIDQLFFRTKSYGQQLFDDVKVKNDLEKVNVGEPLVMKLPPEAVIPVHTPSNPEDHVGYYVLLDPFGNPINRTKESDYYKELGTKLTQGDFTSQLLESAGRTMDNSGLRNNHYLDASEAVRLYADVVEKDLVNRLKNGIYGEGVEVSRPLDVYQVMMSRALASKNTQILFIPADLVTYIAFDYNQHGVGVSLLEKNKIISGLRSMLLFSDTMSAVKNSTGKTHLNIELDPNDPDPSSTVEYMVAEYAKNRNNSFPLGTSNPSDIIDSLQNAGVDIQVSGNSAYPETKLAVEDYSSSKVEVDSTLRENIDKMFFMGLGLSPETIDSSSDVEFATSIVTSNLLLAKRVLIYNEALCFFLKDFINKYSFNNEIIINKLIKIVESNKTALPKEGKTQEPIDLVIDFLENIEVSLPKPDSAKLENQLESFEKYVSALEVMIDAYMGEDSFAITEFDDIEEHIKTIREATLSYFKREWLRKNNVLPELMDIVLKDIDGNSLFDLAEIHGGHMESVGKAVYSLVKRVKEDRAKRDKKREKEEARLAAKEAEEEEAQRKLEEAEAAKNNEEPETPEDGDVPADDEGDAKNDEGDVPADDEGDAKNDEGDVPADDEGDAKDDVFNV